MEDDEFFAKDAGVLPIPLAKTSILNVYMSIEGIIFILFAIIPLNCRNRKRKPVTSI